MRGQTVGLRLMLNLFCIIFVEKRKLYSHDFIIYIFNTGLYQDICDLICFKLGMMLDTVEVYSRISSLNHLDLHSRSQGYRKAVTCAVILM